jgi:arylsulfatase A-like enzyme
MSNSERRAAAGSSIALVFVLAIALGCWSSSTSSTSMPGAGDADPAAALVSPGPAKLIVLISMDTVRADHLSVYGYERFTSPTLETLALEGVVFDDASATAPWTLPSHASMFTGRHPTSIGVTTVRSKLREDIPTLASIFAEAGFDTAAVVNSSWLRKESFNITQGFDKYLFIEERPKRRTPSTWVTDQGLAWLRDRGNRPLFLFMHYYDVHSDYASQRAYEELFVTPYEGIADGSGWQLKEAGFEREFIEMCRKELGTPGCLFGGAQNKLDAGKDAEIIRFDEDDVRHLGELYDAGIRQLDAELGRFLAALRREGILDEALLVVTSDHGEAFMEHGHLDHFIPLYQEILHVPLLFRGPGIAQGKRVSLPVSGVDIAPSLLSLAGLAVPPKMEGLDLTPLLRGEAPVEFAERDLYGEASGGGSHELMGLEDYVPQYRSLRRGRHKLIYEHRGDSYALYDLDRDPGEQVDISSQQPELTQRLIAAMRERYEGIEAAPAPDAELAPEEVERLRALGYIL